jgi:sulfotransferase family protein
MGMAERIGCPGIVEDRSRPVRAPGAELQSSGGMAVDRSVKPDRFALIIGAMKCGTTSLFNYLASHPAVAPSREKEPNYFCAEDFSADDLDDYFALWDWEPGVHEVAIEASVNYSKMPTKPNCAERIAHCKDLDVRFIYSMRNPIDRIASHVYHAAHEGWMKPLDAGVPEHAINCSKYAMQLEPYVSLFGRERILLLVLEEFEKAPREQLLRICQFLGIDPDVELSDVEVRHNPASSHSVEHPLWSRLREIGPVHALSRLVPARLRQSLLRSTSQKLDVRRELTPQERTLVTEALSSDLARLRSEHGIDPERAWGIQLS